VSDGAGIWPLTLHSHALRIYLNIYIYIYIYTYKCSNVARPEHIGIAVGMLLLSCVQADINAISYLLTVSGRHLQLSTNPDVVLY